MSFIVSSFVAFCLAIAFTNGTPDADENCACSNENDDLIEEKLDEAKNLAEKQEQKDDKSYQGLLGSIFGHLGSFLSSVLSAVLALFQGSVALLPESLASALKGLSKKGLVGLLRGLVKGLNSAFKRNSAMAVIGGLTGSDPEINALIEKNINEALERVLAEINSDCGNEDGLLNDVIELLSYVLRGNLGIVAPLSTTFLGSMVKSLLKGLSAGLSKNGLVGGLLGGVGAAVYGLTKNTRSSLIDYLKAIFT